MYRTLMTVSEAADFLRVAHYRIYQLARQGVVPGVVRLGRQVRFDPDRLEVFVSQGGANSIPARTESLTTSEVEKTRTRAAKRTVEAA